MKKITLRLGLLLISFMFNLHAAIPTKEEKEEQPHIGNFSLPISQQPSALVSFGQNIVQKGQAQLFLLPNYLKAPQQRYPNLSPSLLYGFTDKASLFLTVPVAINYADNRQRSSGFDDTSVQGEYAFYNKDDQRYSEQATIVGGMTFPSGSIVKQPETGQGTVGYFIGTTFNKTFIDWLFFTSPGVQIFRPSPTESVASQYFYQAGIGRNIKSVPDQSILLALLELDGQYSKTHLQVYDLRSHSGGNIVLATPSLWFSTQHFILQAGYSFPLSQHINETKEKVNYYAVVNLGWLLE